MRAWVIETAQQRERLAAFVARLPLDRPQEVTVREYVPRRTNPQNAKLWALYGEAARYTGHSAEEIHEFALMRFFGTKEIEVAGMVRHVPLKRSSQRNRKEFSEFLDSTEAWLATEFGVIA